MAKILKTVRLTEDMIQIIDAQAGENWNAKLEHLIQRCILEGPQLEKELAALNTKKQCEEELLNQIREDRKKQSEKLKRLKLIIDNIEIELNQCYSLSKP